ncbi:hypothetical protein AYI70_g9169, partial [Smittium culicis]
TLLPTGEPRTGDIHRCQRHGMGDRCGLPILLGIVESLGGVDAHQRQGIINNIVCTPAPECCRALGISLLRQYHDISLRQEVWWNDFSRVTEDRGEHMESLPGIEYPPSSYIRTINDEPRGRTEQTDSSDRMVIIGPCIRENHDPVRGTRCGPARIEREQEGGNLIQLVPRQDIHRAERPRLQLGSLVQPLLLPLLESNRPSGSEGETGTTDDHSDHTAVENRNMVPGPLAIVNRSATSPAGDDSRPGSKKRKISALQQQDVVPNGMEDQRSTIKNQGLTDTAIEWHVSKNNRSPVQASHIVNYLAEIFSTRNLSVNTIKAYKSAIMSLVSEPDTIENSPCLKEFTDALNDTEIKSFFRPSIDISPVINKLRDWGRTEELEIPQLTSKACCLLALCGFLRASDIHRIDDTRTTINNGVLKLVIVAPKEKRNGKPIERPCEINEHSDPILCPVLAYALYKKKVAYGLCPTPHANNSTIMVNMLFRHNKDHSRPLSVDSITRHIYNLSGLIVRPPNTPIPKARAIGVTLAATAGISADNIVSHAFWSNYDMFDTYYRLNRSTQTDMTAAVLPLD